MSKGSWEFLARIITGVMACVLFSMAWMLFVVLIASDVGIGFMFWFSLAMCVSLLGGTIALLWPFYIVTAYRAICGIKESAAAAVPEFGAMESYPPDEETHRARYGGTG